MTSGSKIKSPTMLASRLRWIREDSGLTQRQMAQRFGLTPGAACRISDYETGIREPSLTNLRRYAAFAGVTLSELLGGVDYVPPTSLLPQPSRGGRAPASGDIPPSLGAGYQPPQK